MTVAAPKTRRRVYATPSRIKGVVAIARDAGLDVAGLEVAPDGTIRVMEARAIPQPTNDFDRWQDQL